jgi:hypothetical protein
MSRLRFDILSALLLPLTLLSGHDLGAQTLLFLGDGQKLEVESSASERVPLTMGLDSSWSKNWILGAAHAPGKYGSYFQTDLQIMAPCAGSSGDIVFDLWSLPNNTSANGSQVSRVYTIPAGGFGIIQDVVGVFGQTGGSTLYLQVDSARSTASSSCRELSSWAYTYTRAENGGNYSTGLLSTFGNTIYSSSTTFYGAITGIEQNDLKRTNVIIFTPYSSTGIVRLYVFDETGKSIGTKDVTVYGYSATQVSLNEFTIASPGGSLRMKGSPSSPTSIYFEAAAVTVDNLTNDGFFRHVSIHSF